MQLSINRQHNRICRRKSQKDAVQCMRKRVEETPGAYIIIYAAQTLTLFDNEKRYSSNCMSLASLHTIIPTHSKSYNYSERRLSDLQSVGS